MLRLDQRGQRTHLHRSFLGDSITCTEINYDAYILHAAITDKRAENRVRTRVTLSYILLSPALVNSPPNRGERREQKPMTEPNVTNPTAPTSTAPSGAATAPAPAARTLCFGLGPDNTLLLWRNDANPKRIVKATAPEAVAARSLLQQALDHVSAANPTLKSRTLRGTKAPMLMLRSGKGGLVSQLGPKQQKLGTLNQQQLATLMAAWNGTSEDVTPISPPAATPAATVPGTEGSDPEPTESENIAPTPGNKHDRRKAERAAKRNA